MDLVESSFWSYLNVGKVIFGLFFTSRQFSQKKIVINVSLVWHEASQGGLDTTAQRWI